MDLLDEKNMLAGIRMGGGKGGHIGGGQGGPRGSKVAKIRSLWKKVGGIKNVMV